MGTEALVPVEESVELQQQIADIQAVIAGREAMKTILLQHLPQRCWDVFGDDVRLNRRGAEQIAQLAGLNVETIEREKIPLDGGHYEWRYQVRVTHRESGRFFDYDGFCSSRDKFFSAHKTLAEVDETNIARKAQANAIANAVGRLFGIQLLPLETYREYSGRQIKAAFKYKGQPQELPATPAPALPEATAYAPLPERDEDWTYQQWVAQFGADLNSAGEETLEDCDAAYKADKSGVIPFGWWAKQRGTSPKGADMRPRIRKIINQIRGVVGR